jgi:hypothetical protein
MSDDFDLAHDKISDQPVTVVGGNKSAAAWHPSTGPTVALADYEASCRNLARVEAERDALARVIEQVRDMHQLGQWLEPWDGSNGRKRNGCWHGGCIYCETDGGCDTLLLLATSATSLLAHHDVEVNAQALDDFADSLDTEDEAIEVALGGSSYVRETAKARAAAIRTEAN